MADIPGIIEGAHEGRGLGLRFLKHIERNSMLLFVIPADTSDVRAEYRTLLGELEQFNPELLDKDRILGISKADILDEELRAGLKKELPGRDSYRLFLVRERGEHPAAQGSVVEHP